MTILSLQENNHRKIENGNGIHDETFNEESYPLLRNGEENQLSRSIKQKSDLKSNIMRLQI